MDKITFSVIVPIYNVENYLCQCVDSILSQENCEFELILVDDGSTDQSGEICDQYAEKDTRVRVIHKENGGLSDARNAGVREADGEYLLFVDSDDYIAEQSLQKISFIIKENNNPDIVFLECVKVYTDDQQLIPMNDGVTEEVNAKRGDNLKAYIAELPKYPASACSKAIRRNFFCENNLYFKKGIICEDLEWAVRVFLDVQTASYCSMPYYFYRQKRAGSISNSPNPKMALDVLDIVEQCRCLEEKQINKSSSYMVRSVMEYIFRFLCIHCLQMMGFERQNYIRQVKQYDYVLGTRKDKASKICTMIYRLLGAEMTGRLMQLYLKVRREKNG